MDVLSPHIHCLHFARLGCWCYRTLQKLYSFPLKYLHSLDATKCKIFSHTQASNKPLHQQEQARNCVASYVRPRCNEFCFSHVTPAQKVSGETVSLVWNVEWQVRSPDLSKFDIFLFYYWKEKYIQTIPKLSPCCKKLSTRRSQTLVQKSRKSSSTVWRKRFRTVSIQEVTTSKKNPFETS